MYNSQNFFDLMFKNFVRFLDSSMLKLYHVVMKELRRQSTHTRDRDRKSHMMWWGGWSSLCEPSPYSL